jgi:hypothetical protein
VIFDAFLGVLGDFGYNGGVFEALFWGFEVF